MNATFLKIVCRIINDLKDRLSYGSDRNTFVEDGKYIYKYISKPTNFNDY